MVIWYGKEIIGERIFLNEMLNRKHRGNEFLDNYSDERI